MSAALLCLAGALLAWPPAAAGLGRLRGRPGRRWAAPGASTVPWAAAAGAGLVTALLSTPVVAVLAAGCGLAAGRVWVRRGAVGDADRQVRGLAEALGALAAELRAGRPLEVATATAVAACGHPGAAARLGAVLRGALPDGAGPADVAAAHQRIGAAVLLSARTGCSLAAVVGAVEDDLRARLRTAAELRTAVAGPRASATVLAGLPVLGLLMGAGVGADPWRVLTTTPTGTVLLVVGVALEVAGTTWSGRLVRRAATR